MQLSGLIKVTRVSEWVDQETRKLKGHFVSFGYMGGVGEFFLPVESGIDVEVGKGYEFTAGVTTFENRYQTESGERKKQYKFQISEIVDLVPAGATKQKRVAATVA